MTQILYKINIRHKYIIYDMKTSRHGEYKHEILTSYSNSLVRRYRIRIHYVGTVY